MSTATRSLPATARPGRCATRPTEAAPDSLRTEVLEVLLDRAAAPVPRAAVRDALAVHGAGVEGAIDGLVEAGIAAEDADGLLLTGPGHAHAERAVRRHRLVERLLFDLLGVAWWQVHHEAERFEGTISDELEARLVDTLGDPGTCPHGNPIPGSANRPDQTGAVALADAPEGPLSVVRITETLEGDDEALQLLQGCGFVPGRDAELKRRERGWVEVAGAIHDAALPPHVAAHTYVIPR